MNGIKAQAIGSGIERAAQNIQRGVLGAYDIKTRRELQEQGKQRTDIIDAQRTAQFASSEQLKDLQIQNMNLQLKKLTDESTKKETYSSFDGYRHSGGDVKYLNSALKNENVKRLMNGVNGMYKLNTTSEEDISLLNKIGVSAEDISDEGFDPTRYVKVTRDGSAPGAYDIVDLYGAYAKTGYINTMRKEEIDELTMSAKKAATRKSEALAGQEELETESAAKWLESNPTKSYQDYLNIKKTASTRITTASLKSEYADLQVEQSTGDLSKENEIRLQVLDRLFKTDSDEKREILKTGIGITAKYKGQLFEEAMEITDDDILASKLYAQQAGIKPDAKVNRDFKEEFNTVRHGRRLVEDVIALKDEELSRGIVDTGIKAVTKLLTDEGFKKLSKEDQAKQLKTIEMDTKLGMFLAKYIKSISGTAVADAEFTRLTNLFSGSQFNNVQTLRQGVVTFVKELDTNFKDSAQTNLIDNPSTTLDLVKRYRELDPMSEIPVSIIEEPLPVEGEPIIEAPVEDTKTYDTQYNKFKSLIGQTNPNTGKKLIGIDKNPPFAPIYEEVE